MARKQSGAKLDAASGPRKSWSNARTATFMATLRQTANVSAACRAADMTPAAAYKRRSLVPAFRAAWNDALCEGYATLEQLLLSQAIAELKPDDEAPAALPRLRLSERTIVSLLSLHRQTVRDLRAGQRADAGASPENEDEARAELEATLGMMRDRLAVAEADGDAGGDDA